MARKLKKDTRPAKSAAVKKARGYTVASVQTTDPVQLRAMHEPDVQTGGGANARHQVAIGG